MSSPQDYIWTVSRTYHSLLKLGKTKKEAWLLIEKDIRKVLMDLRLSWIYDAVYTFCQELQDSGALNLGPVPDEPPPGSPPEAGEVVQAAPPSA
eukprot:2096780-Rhodomonas_salina.1